MTGGSSSALRGYGVTGRKEESFDRIFRRDRRGEQVLWAARRARVEGQLTKLIRRSLS